MDLLQLPPELLMRISSYLTTPELGCFRRSCKQVEAALFNGFAREFFSKKQFMIEHVSLQALVDISNHPRLSSQLSDVIISLHTLRLDPDQRYKTGHISRTVLLETGQARDMLVEAFSKLPNLRTVGLRDYDARGRYRDGENASWRSYGWSCGVNHDPNVAVPPPLYRSRPPVKLESPESTFPLILYALGRAQAKPQKVEVFLRKSDKLTPTSFNVLDGYLGAAVIPVLEGLSTLMLTIGLDEPTSFGLPYLSYDSSVTDAPLKRLLQHTPNLEALRLNFEEQQFFAYRFLEWLGTPAPVPFMPTAATPASPIAPVPLSNLTAFDLGMLIVAAPTLLNVVTKFNLLSLSLWKVTIHSADDRDLRKAPDHWAGFLQDLADALPASTQLKSVLLGFIFQGRYTRHKSESVRIQFASPHTNSGQLNSKDLLDTVKYQADYGSSVKDWLQDMSTRTTVEAVEEVEVISNDLEDEFGVEDDESEEDD